MRSGTKEEHFFDILGELFVGKRAEGKSGFINLMQIKHSYYTKGILPQLRKDIDEALLPFPSTFREELFDRLYTFFRRYFGEPGSIYFRLTPPHEHVYEKIYTDDRDVMLFWKTHMLYYVKTDRLFHAMDTEVDGFRFSFDVETLDTKRANEKRALVFAFKERKADGTFVFTVTYSEQGRKTKLAEIRRAIRDALGLKRYTQAVPSEETLEKAFRLFGRQSEVDFFINKDARAFLREQFDLWLYQYLFEPGEEGSSRWTEERLRQLQTVKRIAYKIIDFIAQFEDELVRVWNKPKFVLESHYVITPDRIAAQEGGMEVLERLLQHPGMEAQVEEWRKLGMVGPSFQAGQIKGRTRTASELDLHERYRYLPLDTKHFPDLEGPILALFDPLDEALDGWLIHSENYQALKTLLPKFRERIKTIYIDPPYNTGNGDFLYHDRFRHSSWLTMMENRLALAREWLRPDGVIFVSVDDAEVAHAWKLMESLFGAENAVTAMVWKGGRKNDARLLSVSHDYILTFLKDREKLLESGERWRVRKAGLDAIYTQVQRLRVQFGENDEAITQALQEWYRSLPKDHPALAHRHYNRVDERGVFFPGDISWPGGGGPTYEVLHPVTNKPVAQPSRGWVFSTKERMQQAIKEGRVYFGEDERQVPKLKRYLHETEGQVLDSVFYKDRRAAFQQLREMLGTDRFRNPKDVEVIRDLIEATVPPEDGIVLDFFAGSGTTAQAVMEANRADGGERKYILIEMADYFGSVLLPRIKKAIFSDAWKDGEAQKEGIGQSHFIKYFRLEQYEDVLQRARYRDDDIPLWYTDDPYSQYVFLRDPKLLDNDQTGEAVMTYSPGEEPQLHLDRLYPRIDLAESLSAALGVGIRRIQTDGKGRIVAFTLEDGREVDALSPSWKLLRPFIWW